MTWWERVMLYFFPDHHPKADQSERVEAALEQLGEARQRAVTAAGGVEREARAHRSAIEGERMRIRARIESQAARSPVKPTSEVRSLVEATLRRMSEGAERQREH